MATHPGPTDDELSALADALAAEATQGFEKFLSPSALQLIRDSLADELFCTSYGRDQLRRCLPYKQGDASAEVLSEVAERAEKLKKDSSS